MFDDHLVVESPGNLPSQVKIDKIRNAHFARNSHIAEYLKDYKYVKDFGEGVDRMYREMEAFGLPVPEYRQDSFILKAVIKNSGFDCKNLGIGAKNLGIDAQNLGIGAKNLGIEQIKMAILNSHVNLTSKNKLIKLTEKIDINQVFGAKEVMAELKCSPPTATNLIKLLKALHLIEPVKGAGKSKYVFLSPQLIAM
jgi:ATP-dependent DNA helicase RecG